MRFSNNTIIVDQYPSPEEDLLYNTRTQALVKVPSELRTVVENFEEVTAEVKSHYIEDLDALHDMGLVVDDEGEDLQKLKNHMVQLRTSVNQKYLPVTILTTMSCNLKCVYCFEESTRTNEKMTESVQKQVESWLKVKLIEQQYQKLFITFYGGEPLANKPAIDEIAGHMQAWCRSKGLDFNFMLQTNGYLMTSELIDRYKQLGLSSVRISVDGVGEEHDKNRPLRKGGGTFDVIMRNIQSCCDQIPIGISVSYDSDNVTKIERLLDYFSELGILHKLGRFLFSPVHATLGPSGNSEFIQNSSCMCNYEDDNLVAANQKIHAYMSKYGLSMKSGMSTSVCPVTREEGGMTIDQKGYLYKCNSMLGHPEFSTGHISEQQYNKQHQEFLSLDVWRQCPVDCTYMPMCSGGCRLSSFLKNQNFKRPTCHKPYLNRMARDLIIKDYEKAMSTAREVQQRELVT